MGMVPESTGSAGMTDKELKRLSRAELLELLLIQTKETERLRLQLEQANQKLADRQIQIMKSGSLAEAVLAVNGVVDAANAAAAQYLENIARMEEETQLRCQQMLEQARLGADQIRADTHVEAKTKKPHIPDEEKPLDEFLTELRGLIGS